MTPERIVVVTGANRGIGFEACRQFAKAGFRVILTARDAARGESASADLRAEGLDVMFHQLDVADGSGVERFRTWLRTDIGRVDVLVNNAGIYLDEGKKLSDIPVELFEETLKTNLSGALRMIHAVLPLMKKQKYGRIVNISSGLGAFDSMSAGTGSYKVSKLALNGLTRIIADEVDPKHIKVNTMCPGWVRTDMGGRFATRSPKKATETILWLAQLDEKGPTGGFFRDKRPIDW